MRHWTHRIMPWFSTDWTGIVDKPIHNASILFSCSDLPQSVWLTWFKHYQWLTLDTLGLDRQPADVTDLRVARVGPLHHWLCHWWFLRHLYNCRLVLVVLEILSGPQPSVQASLVAELGVHCPRQVQADDDQEDHLSWMLETPPSSGLVSGETRSTLSGRNESTASSMKWSSW